MEHDISLDRLHEILEEIPIDLELIIEIKDMGEDFVGPYQVPFLSEACQDIFGYWSAYGTDIPRSLTMPPKLINNFIKDFDDVHVDDAKMMAERLISYLKSIEGQVAAKQLGSTSGVLRQSKDSSGENLRREMENAFNNVEAGWIVLERSDEVGVIIAELSGLLGRIIRTAKTSNLPQNARSFSELEMAQIIAILETALNMLKAPLVERGLLKKAADKLSDVGRKTAEKKTEAALGKLADLGAKLILKLLISMAS